MSGTNARTFGTEEKISVIVEKIEEIEGKMFVIVERTGVTIEQVEEQGGGRYGIYPRKAI